jgi:hypothetical protein
MTSLAVWNDSIREAIGKTPMVESTINKYAPNDNSPQRNIEAEFEDTVNTRRVLERVSEKIEKKTRIIVRPQRGTIQFYFENKKRASQIKGKQLIRKILTEDIPSRKSFTIDFTEHSESVTVEAPTMTPVRLFENIQTNFWVLSNIYFENGMYNQTFTQFDLSDMTNKEVIDKYGVNRLQEILWTIELPCGDCTGVVKFTPPSDAERKWEWKCDTCGKLWGTQTFNSILEEVNPLSSRSKIEQMFHSKGEKQVDS